FRASRSGLRTNPSARNVAPISRSNSGRAVRLQNKFSGVSAAQLETQRGCPRSIKRHCDCFWESRFYYGHINSSCRRGFLTISFQPGGEIEADSESSSGGWPSQFCRSDRPSLPPGYRGAGCSGHSAIRGSDRRSAGVVALEESVWAVTVVE